MAVWTASRRDKPPRRMTFETAAGMWRADPASLSVPVGTRGSLPLAQAQNLGQRVVMGTVVDADAAAVAGATVFLRNSKTKSIRAELRRGRRRR